MYQPLKYCADCHRVAIAGPETPTNVYNRIRYCPDCAKDRTRYNNANYQKQLRRDRKERNRLLREQCALLREENTALKQRVENLARMNQELRGYV